MSEIGPSQRSQPKSKCGIALRQRLNHTARIAAQYHVGDCFGTEIMKIEVVHAEKIARPKEIANLPAPVLQQLHRYRHNPRELASRIWSADSP